MDLSWERVRQNVAAATTPDLLDRVTVYRAGMVPEALELIEAELRRRGVSAADLVDYQESRSREPLLVDRDGLVLPCSFCERPAVGRRWGFMRLGFFKLKVPLLPWLFRHCASH